MKIAHISDTHLGYRAYGRSTPEGVNQREVDVMKTFKACLDQVVERDPDIVVHSGDVFHVVRPSNLTVVGAFKALAEFQRKRAGKPMIIIGGNHDTPRTTDSGNILKLFAAIEGVRVVTDKLEVLEIPELDLEVMCVPDNSLRQGENYEYSPTLPRKHGILALHGVEHSLIRTGVGDIDIAETRHERWTYVGLGDYHIHKAYGPNICYAGSTDFASTNVWEESTLPKGWVWFDSEAGRLEHVQVQTRAVIDLPRIDAGKLEPQEVENRMFKNVDWDGEPIVRQRVINAHPSLRARLSHAVVRDIASKALHYQLDLSPPDLRVVEGGQPHERQGKTLEQSWQEHSLTAAIPAGVDRQELRDLGTNLLKEVQLETEAVEA